jgi:small subunit ribosomal protein S17
MVDAVETQAPQAAPEGATAPRRRKERTGEVISDKMEKTIVVRVERRFRHPKFKKVVTQYKKFYAHDEKREAKVGDTVLIEETRPLSKMKNWRLVQVVEKNTDAKLTAAQP